MAQDALEPAPADASAVDTAPEVPTQRGPEIGERFGEQQALFELPEQASSVEDSAAERSEKPDRVLAPRERAVLDFESRRWKHAGQKEQAIRDTFELSPTNYFQILNALLDDPAALAYRPTLVARLRRLREDRRRERK